MITKRRITKKTSKGYRLKDSTHKMIEKLQLIINENKDTVLRRALKLYYIHIRNSDKGVLKNDFKNSKIK